MEWFDDWTECVSLCHEYQSFHSRQRLIEQLSQLPTRTNGAPPILAAKIGQVAAYLVIHPGCLCSIGGIYLPKPMRAEDAVRAGQLLKLLIDQASSETELVQAITYAGDDNTILEACYAVAGLKRIADLHQMECSLAVPRRETSLSNEGNVTRENTASGVAIEYVPWQPNSSDLFTQLVDQTYVDTLDVPELNGIRDSSNTLVGYAACLPESQRHRPWWILRHPNGESIGCLLLCPYSDFAELVYVGLVPGSRGKGYSRSIMQFAHDWTLERGLHRMVLAVDYRNEPAIRIYRLLGYEIIGGVTAWMRPTRTTPGTLLTPFGFP
jgi:GNAT superfamily N-acetyltransferase